MTINGAVNFPFFQGLLTLMCNNLRLKADINFFLFCCVGIDPKSITGCKILWFNTRGFVVAFGQNARFS